MNNLLKITLIFALCLLPFELLAQAAKLTNSDVIALQQAGFSAELIITKIKASSTEFNTSVEAMAVLKRAGISESVIAAMLDTATPVRAAEPVQMQRSINPDEVILREAAPIEVELTDTVSSQEVKEGDLIYFTVITPVVAQGRIVIPRGAPAIARVIRAEAGKSWARGGQLAWQMQSVMAVDGERIPLRFSGSSNGDNKKGEMWTGIAVTTVLAGGVVALLWGFKKGKAAVVPAGKRFMVYVHADSIINSRYAANENIYMQQQRRVELPGYRNGKPIPMKDIIEAERLSDLRRRN